MGHGTEARQRADAMRAANMRAEGYTSRQIAEAIGITPEQVKKRVELGQRLLSAREPDPKSKD